MGDFGGGLVRGGGGRGADSAALFWVDVRAREGKKTHGGLDSGGGLLIVRGLLRRMAGGEC
ncbi:MAG: hypothetical protein RIS92_2352 [Verrucomicrobiota bacterium]